MAGVGENTFRSTSFGEDGGYDENRYKYGGQEGGLKAYQDRQRLGVATADNRQGPQADMTQANESRDHQNRAMNMSLARATGATPSIAQMQGNRMMADAAAQQRAQAASARGAGGLALAQQNAAGNTAAAQSNIGAQTAEAAARERLAAEQAYGQQSGQVRGMDAQQAQYQAGLDLQSRALNDQRAMAHEKFLADSNSEQNRLNLAQQQLQQQSHMGAQQMNRQTNSENSQNEVGILDRAAAAVGGVLGGFGKMLSDDRAKAPIMPMPSDVLSKGGAELGGIGGLGTLGGGGMADMNAASPWNPQGGTTRLKGGGMDVMGTIGKANEDLGAAMRPSMAGVQTDMLSDMRSKAPVTPMVFHPTYGWHQAPGEVPRGIEAQVAEDRRAMAEDTEAKRNAEFEARWGEELQKEIASQRREKGDSRVLLGRAPKGYAREHKSEPDSGRWGEESEAKGGGKKYTFNPRRPGNVARDDEAPGTEDYRKAMASEGKDEERGGLASAIFGSLGRAGENVGRVSDNRAKLMVSDEKAKRAAYERGAEAGAQMVADHVKNNGLGSPVVIDSRALGDRAATAVGDAALDLAKDKSDNAGAVLAAERDAKKRAVYKRAAEANRFAEERAAAEDAAATRAQRNLVKTLTAPSMGPATQLTDAYRGAPPEQRARAKAFLGRAADQVWMANPAASLASDNRAKLSPSSVSGKTSSGGESRDDYLEYIKRTTPKPVPKKMSSEQMKAKADDMLAGMKANLDRGPSVGSKEPRPAPWLDQYMDDEKMAEANRHMRGFPYRYRDDVPGGDGGEGVHVGPSAQDMASHPVTRTAVEKDPRSGMLALDRDKLLKINSSGIAALQREVDKLKARAGKGK